LTAGYLIWQGSNNFNYLNVKTYVDQLQWCKQGSAKCISELG